MKIKLVLSLAILGCLTTSANSQAASYETPLKFCNNSEEKIFISVAYKPAADENIMARGWWGLDAKSCNEISFPIDGDQILVHAQSSSQIYHWLGDVNLCVNSVDAYDLENASTLSCDQAGQEQRAFKSLSLAALRSVAEGETPVIDFNPSEATKVGGGLKFCNDTTEVVYISYGQKQTEDVNVTINGWFMAQPGKCFEANRQKEADEVLFFANSPSGLRKWSGDIPMCTNDFDGYSHPDAKVMSCAANNLKLQKFTKERIPSSGEYIHHFKLADAHEARAVVELCNKSSEEISFVLGMKDEDFDQVISRGWYMIKAGDCVKDQVVDSESILLHIEKSDRSVLLQGDYQACIDDEKAFQYSQATKMACAGENDKKVGFAEVAIDAGKVRLDIP